MTDHRLTALSPLDGRYADKCADLASLFSEAALIGYRVRVEAAWLRQLAASGHFPALGKLPTPVADVLAALAESVEESGVQRVKAIERSRYKNKAHLHVQKELDKQCLQYFCVLHGLFAVW